jgi:methylated-DNA-protein-cysteine methyltransferase-like protein
MTDKRDTLSAPIWQVVGAIPFGRVASYGQVATMAGLPGYARYVAKVLKALPEQSNLPWHRVIRAEGRIAFAPGSHQAIEQAALLVAEGVRVINNKVDMKAFAWQHL